MKQKLLFIALLLICTSSVFAGSTLSQENWRWRNDNGDETAATFKAAQNTAITLAGTETIRLRVRVENTSNSADQHGIYKVMYSTTPANQSSFTDVTEDATTNAFVYTASANVSVVDGYATSNDTYLATVNKGNLSPYTYAAGIYINKGRIGNTKVLHSNYSDFEFVIKATAKVLAGATYYFKVDNADTKTATDPTQTMLPHLTAAGVLPVSFIALNLINEGNGVKLNWSTASEQDNANFEISRSSDGVNWTIVTSVAGAGNSSNKNVYTAKDNSPANGVNYYRLTQYDENGASKVLSIKTINVAISAASAQVSVYPNPTISDVNFVLAGLNVNQNITATLVDLTGKIVYQETYTNATNGVSYRVNVSKKPTAGVYVLKIEGNSLLLNKRVVFK